jgi:hypothetical protein
VREGVARHGKPHQLPRPAGHWCEKASPATENRTSDPSWRIADHTAAMDDAAALVAARACADALGVDARDAAVVRSGTSALVRLPVAGVLVRVDRAERRDVAGRQVAVARALEAAEVPATRLWPHDAQPLDLDRSVVTVWRWEDVLPGAPSPGALGALAGALHHRTREVIDVPPLDPFTAIGEQLDLAVAGGATEPDDLRLLRDELAACHERWEGAPADPLGTSVVHGDLHGDNVIQTAGGPLLCDFELSGTGPPTYDLAARLVAVERYGEPAAAYDAFCAAYGFDLRDWPDHEVRTRTYALWVTAWAVAHAHRSPAAAAEARRRLVWWRHPADAPRWQLR